MKLTLTDKLHVSIGLNIFLAIWFSLEAIDKTINGIWFGIVTVVFIAFFKEVNDKYGWIPFLLTDGKTKTGINGRDVMMTVTIPSIIMLLKYAIYG